MKLKALRGLESRLGGYYDDFSGNGDNASKRKGGTMTISDIIVVMKDGVIQQIGSPYEIYHQPSNLFVAEFIGDPRINLFDATLEQRDSRSVLHIGETGDKPAARPAAVLAAGAACHPAGAAYAS